MRATGRLAQLLLLNGVALSRRHQIRETPPELSMAPHGAGDASQDVWMVTTTLASAFHSSENNELYEKPVEGSTDGDVSTDVSEMNDDQAAGPQLAKWSLGGRIVEYVSWQSMMPRKPLIISDSTLVQCESACISVDVAVLVDGYFAGRLVGQSSESFSSDNVSQEGVLFELGKQAALGAVLDRRRVKMVPADKSLPGVKSGWFGLHVAAQEAMMSNIPMTPSLLEFEQAYQLDTGDSYGLYRQGKKQGFHMRDAAQKWVAAVLLIYSEADLIIAAGWNANKPFLEYNTQRLFIDMVTRSLPTLN